MLTTRPYGFVDRRRAERLMTAAAVIVENLSLVVHRGRGRLAQNRLEKIDQIGTVLGNLQRERALRRRPWKLAHRQHHPPAAIKTGANGRGFAIERRAESQQPIERRLRHHQPVLLALHELLEPGLDVAADGHGFNATNRPRQQCGQRLAQ